MFKNLCFASAVLTSIIAWPAFAFTINISSDGGPEGGSIQNSSCNQYGEESFTGAAGNTVYSQKQAYSGSRSMELTVNEGGKGFGGLGGIINFSNCSHIGGRDLKHGEEIWIRTRMFFPKGFEFNQNGMNKFLRVRMFHDKDGKKVSEGYNDLYINPQLDKTTYYPFNFIFEGAHRWFKMGTKSDFFTLGEWKTVEYYLKFDHVSKNDGGQAVVRVWIDGKLLGESFDRITMKTPNSYAKALYFFTYWDNEGAHKTQSFYADDLTITTDTPPEKDSFGNPYIGMSDLERETSPPKAPRPLN